MKTPLQQTVWIRKGEKQDYYLVPSDSQFTSGTETVVSLEEEEQKVVLQELEPFRVPEEEVLQFLDNTYRSQLEATKQALIRLNRFAALSGKMDEDFIRKMAQTEFDRLNPDEQQPFTMGKEMITELLASVQQPGVTPEEQLASFQKTFTKVPDILKYFDENNLALAAKNPEAWANEMHEKLFGEQEDAAKQAKTDRLKKEVQESIARGLKSAGMTPIDPETGEPIE